MIRNPSGDRARDGSNDYCPDCEVLIDRCTCPRDFGEPEPISDNATNETGEEMWLALKARLEHLEQANKELYAACKRYQTLLKQHERKPTTQRD